MLSVGIGFFLPLGTLVARYLPRSYDRQAVRDYWAQRPISVARRLGHVVYELVPLAGSYVRDFLIVSPEVEHAVNLQTLHASQLREALTNLGPAWVKGESILHGLSEGESSFLVQFSDSFSFFLNQVDNSSPFAPIWFHQQC